MVKYILYAEDDQDDREMLTEMLSQVDGHLKLECVNDGYEVIQYLKAIEDESAYPCVIILDINMPGLDGMETLRLLRKDDRFNSIPIIIFSTSDSKVDIERAHAFGANEFITKPVKPKQLETIATKFALYCHTV